jgi:hypothetical protein
MQSLRSTRLLARLVLAWFAFVVVAAAAAPALHPQALDMVCAGSGMKLVPADSGDGEAPRAAALDCPLCIVVAPPPAQVLPVQPAPAGRLLQPILSTRSADTPAPALPPRGPPAFFA